MGPVSEGILRAFQVHGALTQAQINRQEQTRLERQFKIDEEIGRANLRLAEGRAKRLQEKEGQDTRLEINALGGYEVVPAEGGGYAREVDLGDAEVPGSSGETYRLPFGRMRVPVEPGRMVEEVDGRNYALPTLDERVTQEVRKQDALNRISVPDLEGNISTVDRRGLSYYTGALNRKAADAREKNRQTFQAGEGQKTRQNQADIAAGNRTAAMDRAKVRAGTPKAPTAEERQGREAKLIEGAARKVIEENQRSKGRPEDAVRRAEIYYQDDPIVSRYRDRVIKRVKQILQLSDSGQVSDAQIDEFLRNDDEQAAAPAAARPRAKNRKTGEVVEFDGQQWVPVQTR